MSDDLAFHSSRVLREMLAGRVVPFLGAGVNLCGRSPETRWQPRQHLPSGAELAQYLANRFGHPGEAVHDLVRVSQYVAVMTGSGPLYEELRSLFDVDYQPTVLHVFLATLPRLLREKGYPPCYQFIVTTNYDDALERAFRDAGEPIDVVTYMADGEHRGKFLHCPSGGEPGVIERPNEYRSLPLDERPVILKIHGAIDRANPDRDSFVITEDHYIDYLTHTDISNLMPVTLAAKLRRSHFLFLGYSLRDWNLRVILHRIWGERRLTYKSWAIQRDPQPIEKEYWLKRDVDILKVRLEDYVTALRDHLQALQAA